MYKSLLLPNKYKKIGFFILIPSCIAGIWLMVSEFEILGFNVTRIDIFPGLLGQQSIFGTNLTNTVVGVLVIIGSMLVAFSKEKNEDEYITRLRLSSLLWAVLLNYTILLIAFVFLYNMAFFNVMVCNMFTVLIIFILRFNFILIRNAKR